MDLHITTERPAALRPDSPEYNEQIRLCRGHPHYYFSPGLRQIEEMIMYSHEELALQWEGFRYTPPVSHIAVEDRAHSELVGSIVRNVRYFNDPSFWISGEYDSFKAKYCPKITDTEGDLRWVPFFGIMPLDGSNFFQGAEYVFGSGKYMERYWDRYSAGKKSFRLMLGHWGRVVADENGYTFHGEICSCGRCVMPYPEGASEEHIKKYVRYINVSRGQSVGRIVASLIRKTQVPVPHVMSETDGQLYYAKCIKDGIADLGQHWKDGGLSLGITLSFGLGDFMRLGEGEYESGTSCFRSGGEYGCSKQWLALCPYSVVAIFHAADDPTDYYGRAWGQYAPGKFLLFSNFYTNKGISRDAVHGLAAKCAEHLFGETPLWFNTNEPDDCALYTESQKIAIPSKQARTSRFGLFTVSNNGYCYDNADRIVYYTEAGLKEAREQNYMYAEQYADTHASTSDEILRGDDGYDDDDAGW